MRRNLNLIASELRIIGFNLYIPIIGSVVYILFLSEMVLSIILLQLVVVPMAGWWIVWSFEHNLKTSEFKLFQSLPINMKSYLNMKMLVGMVLYSFLLFIILTFTFTKHEWIPMLTLLLPQVMFFTSLFYVLVIVTKNASVSISLIYLYILRVFMPIVKIPYWPDVFLLSHEVLEMRYVGEKAIFTLLYACWFLYIGNLKTTSNMQRYKRKG